ncbi:MAG: protein-L-isoaspartate(D-aspartate) O-methyltransferase, partial [Alphaproteobacteria bacterium]
MQHLNLEKSIRYLSARFLILFLLIAALGFVNSSHAASFVEKRYEMVTEQLETRDIIDKRVLAAMNWIPRHLFVPKTVSDHAYEDRSLPIGWEQTISQPYIVALMSQAAQVSSEDRILEIGTGSGYQAAVLGLLGKEVYTIEIVEPLGLGARKVLKDLGHKNVHVRIGDGNLGWPEHAPFDVILVTAEADEIPQALLDQLNENGCLIMPVGTHHSQNLVRVTKKNGEFISETLSAVRFVPLINGPNSYTTATVQVFPKKN